MDLLTEFLATKGYLPHGYCFTWTPNLLWSMVTADAVIAGSYFSIPLVIVAFFSRRPDVSYRWVAVLFSVFIFACGITHLMGIWTVWNPDYGLQTLTKVFTAAVSLITAVGLWPLLPKALKIPSVAQLQGAISSLEAEVRKRKTAEEHLFDTEQSLAIALNAIGAGFIKLDAQGRISSMNTVAEQITGWPLQQARDRSAAQVLMQPADAGDAALAGALQSITGLGSDEGRTHHLTLQSRNGKRAMVELQATLNRSADGQVSGATLLLRDETKLRTAQTELNRLAAIVESSNDAIISKTLDGTITSWNRGAHDIFGYTAAEAVGQSALILIPKERAEEEMRILASLADGQRVPHFDTVRQTKDGRLIDVSVTISPIRDDGGRIVGGSKIARNITERRQAEEAQRLSEALMAENLRIQEASRVKSQFLANMSHELRTPLNAIVGFAQLLEAGAVAPEDPRHGEYLGHISNSGEHLLRLINDVLDLAKVESGTFEFHAQPVRMKELVDSVVNVLNNVIRKKSLALEVSVDPALPGLLLDPVRFKQVLYNYLSNAIKFTPEGGRISVRASLEGADDFRLEVEDTGIGISAEDLPRLFVEFQQLDSGYRKQHQGTGLGLALTRRLVEAQGGSVGVRSTLGQGSVFHVVMPCSVSTVQQGESAS